MRPYRSLSESQVVILAIGCWLGAWVAWPVPLAFSVPVVVLAWWFRWKVVLILGVAGVALGLGHHSHTNHVPIAPALIDQEVTVINDPKPRGVGHSTVVRLAGGSRAEVTAYGSLGARLARISAGDRVVVRGRLAPMAISSWSRSQHLEGRLVLTEIGSVRPPPQWRRWAENVRSLVMGGAESIPRGYVPLYLGLVVGDDRLQGEAQQAQFRAAGLSHLLAVSGQNVAFVLAVATPAINMFARQRRLVIVVLVLVLFAVVTRMEPSVMRATATAGLATATTLTGHRQSGLRLLALTVTGLVLIDPFLVFSVGFQLSVAASGGILVVGPILAARIKGPMVLIQPLVVTVAAQIGVLPLLLGYFGPVSLGSVPANLLVGWAAGLTMTWGLTVGVVAGLVGGWVGSVLQAPAVAALWWLDGVAQAVPRLPIPRIGLPAVGVLAILGIGIWALGATKVTQEPHHAASARRAVEAWAGVGRLGLMVMVMVILVGAIPRPPTEPTLLSGGQWIPVRGPDEVSVVIIDPKAKSQLLDELLAWRILDVDLVVARSGTRADAPVARAVGDIVKPGRMLAPSMHRLRGATRVTDPVVVTSRLGHLEITSDASRIDIELVDR